MTIDGRYYTEPEAQAYIKQLKRLLKQAVEDIRKLGDTDGGCLYWGECKDCPLYKDQASKCNCWNRETEALELIGGEGG